MRRRVLLLGAGHAHLRIVRAARRFDDRGLDLALLAPGAFWYSGLATGVLGGDYPAALDRVDVARLIAAGGGTMIDDEAVAIDRAGRRVLRRSGPPLAFDMLSLDLGSIVPPIDGPGGPALFAAKPISRLAALREVLETRFAGGAETSVVIAGGGMTAAEIAANVAGLAARRRGGVSVTMVAGGDPLRDLPRDASRWLLRSFEHRRIAVHRSRVSSVADGTAHLDDGGALPFDLFINATGLRPHPLVSGLALPLSPGGGLIVDGTLRAAPDIFAAGDCADFLGRDLPKVGVHAVRQSKILLHNLLAAAEGRPLRSWSPQKRYLAIMNLGDGTGLATRGTLWWHGRSALWLKDRIDRRFLAAMARAP